MKLKVGDRVVVKQKCKICGITSNHTGSMGIIISIVQHTILPIGVKYDNPIAGGDFWCHEERCLEFENTGFDPKKILDKVFGIINEA